MARGGRGRLKYVVDACLWIDLNFGGLISEIFQLPHELVSPDVVVAELESVNAGELKRLGLAMISLSPEDYPLLIRLRATYPQPGINDLTALTVAVNHKINLMTGDGDLRKAAEREGVHATGVLGVLDKLIEQRIINQPRAVRALDSMLVNNARLPKGECQKRFNKWRRGG